MTQDSRLPHGGKILVDALLTHGVDTAFCVPGESYLAVLDALFDVRERLNLLVCRQEGGASFMAEAYGKLTGRPGICFVTRGPGASNATIGVHTAQQDSSPMILFVGQVGGDVAEREAFQEVDYRRMFGSMTKWVAQIDRAERIPEMVSHAFHVAVSGRPGPVVLALPEDMLMTRVQAPATKRYARVAASPGSRDMATVREMLQTSERPLLILGGGDWSADACANIRRFAERNLLPVACTFRRQDLFDNLHPQYAGEVGIGIAPGLKARLDAADLVICVGARLGEQTSGGYTLFDVPRLKQRFIHVHPGAEELGRVYQADLLVNSGMPEFAEAAALLGPADSDPWASWTREAHEEYLENAHPVEVPGPVNPSAIVAWLAKNLPRDTIVTNGAGNFSGWAHRFYPYGGYRTQLGPTNGAMGYGVPAAVAAKAVHPDRTVVAFSGDGDYMMNGQELATAVQYGLPIVVILVNNGMFGTIRMHQEREFPERTHGTMLQNPDFAALARAYGAHGETVTATADFPGAFERAVASGKPAIIELQIDPDVITTRTTLSSIRNKAVQQHLAKAASDALGR
ncbi:MAG: thiamine pyrophosphate-binding protein [Betaproteobacteria bacterium]|nr:thiamine pyrophosphate-binding protein [Betaproteobacteria bacterium]